MDIITIWWYIVAIVLPIILALCVIIISLHIRGINSHLKDMDVLLNNLIDREEKKKILSKESKREFLDDFKNDGKEESKNTTW